MNSPSPESQALLDPVVAFYGRYLSCSPEQLDLLALWTLHTYCYQVAPSSPILNITSRQKQSGKSLCLVLLDMLCYRSWLHVASTPSLLLRQVQRPNPDDPFVGTLLLDDCRIHNRLQGIFAASFNFYGNQLVASKDGRGGFEISREQAFFPKAFAANGCLPASLADLAIPIVLEPKKPGSPCSRFFYVESFELASPLTKRFYHWTVSNSRILDNMAYTEDHFPPELSSRQQDCAEPLLHLADLLGGEWPQRARRALVNVFALSAFEDSYASLQLLSGLRDAFSANNNPAWVSTAGLLNFLHTQDDCIWDSWSKGKPLSPSDLARLLEPFGIRSHNHRTSPTTVAKGYNLHDFEKSWELHLQQPCGSTKPSVPPEPHAPADSRGTAAPGCGGSDVAAQSIKSANPHPKPWSTAALGCEGIVTTPESQNQPARSDVAADSEDYRNANPPGSRCNPQTTALQCTESG